MKERDNILFYDAASLSPTPDIHGRAEADWLQQALQKRFPDEALQVQSVHCNDTGIYRRGLRKITNLPRVYRHPVGTQNRTAYRVHYRLGPCSLE